MNRHTSASLPSPPVTVQPAPFGLNTDASEVPSAAAAPTDRAAGCSRPPGSRDGNIIHVGKSVLIRAPADHVFAFMAQPEHQVQITPSLAEVCDVRRCAAGRLSARFTYRLAGLDLQVRVRVTEYRPARRLAFVLSGRLRGHVRWEFRPVETGTLFTYAVGYSLPAALLEGVAESYLRAYTERDLDSALAYLRARLEDGVVVPALCGGNPYAAEETMPAPTRRGARRQGLHAADRSGPAVENTVHPPGPGPAPDSLGSDIRAAR